MDFACIVLFLAIYHLKPQEWTSVFSTIHFAQAVMFASIAALFFRERSLKPRDFLRTPHDYAMFAFFAWVVIASPTPVDTFKEFFNRLVFYVVIVQTLTNWERISKFLGWWTAMVAITAFLALAGEYFWDPLESHALTHGTMRDRLVLNLSMVNNPNALAHTLAPAFSMIYYFCIWKRPVVMKQIGLALLALPLFAIYLTLSKGGYFAAAAVIMATLTFGRPKFVQGTLLVLMIAAGTTAFLALPRMNELNKTRSDEAIQGRIKAFRFGHEYYTTFVRGVGQGQFIPRLFKDHHYYKASHSTYVQTGAELGPPGMFLFLLIMWCNFRTVIFAKTHNQEQERIRRLLFVLLLSFTISGWMVDFAYRPTFFMFSAACAAFHRHLYRVGTDDEEEEERARSYLPPWRIPLPQPAFAGLPASAAVAALPTASAPDKAAVSASTAAPALAKPRVPVPPPPVRLKPTPLLWQRNELEAEVVAEATDAETTDTAPRSIWNRIGFLDVVVTLIWLKVTMMLWQYAIDHV
jgi:O-antigen ligase